MWVAPGNVWMDFCKVYFLLGYGEENVMMEGICADILAETGCI